MSWLRPHTHITFAICSYTSTLWCMVWSCSWIVSSPQRATSSYISSRVQFCSQFWIPEELGLDTAMLHVWISMGGSGGQWVGRGLGCRSVDLGISMRWVIWLLITPTESGCGWVPPPSIRFACFTGHGPPEPKLLRGIQLLSQTQLALLPQTFSWALSLAGKNSLLPSPPICQHRPEKPDLSPRLEQPF